MRRQLPRWSEFKPLLRPRRISLKPVNRRLAAAHTIADLRAISARRIPRAVFDYVDGAAEEEVSMRRAREAFDQVEFRPNVLRDVGTVDTEVSVLGRTWPVPFALAPTGFTRMLQHEGERAVARAAQRTGVTFALSTMASTTIETAAAEAPAANRWFQLYVWRDHGFAKELIERAHAAGYQALILTVDTPVGGARLRDVRNGLSIPPQLTARTVLDAARHPSWWFNLLTTEPPTVAALGDRQGTAAQLVDQLFDPSITFADLDWIRGAWPGPLIVKGIQTVADARAAVDHGADALVVSNHGGRQLDRAPTPLRLLPSVVDAVGDRAEVLMDSGLRSGSDIAAAIAMGARACLVGRAFLYGLMAAGEFGVQRAISILHTELARTMRLLGVSAVSELNREHAILRD
ncbi:L-lactate dehydrogenase (cytochrome) [Tamaricihabitans halophyticus]|uniref:L-lactate dehydrogenase (Cytochrome) n=1 Tax=Tamaricihabitans halophyticus TaxID=1262583 RepID=A0A4R2QFI9_9PSEU|nr:alpha-hydroxy acid oxidase [Tamaricihabitans halophyticus]TCP47900.1 L-lactate dehydrogenase (cytochrome) [Tamaricihabitans halophyticus]